MAEQLESGTPIWQRVVARCYDLIPHNVFNGLHVVFFPVVIVRLSPSHNFGDEIYLIGGGSKT